MTKYELLYIISTKLEEDKRDELIARFEGVVTSAGGTAEVSKWGSRRLAYPINFQQEGFYVQMNYSASEDLPGEIERQMRLLDTILRFMTVKKVENKHTLKAEHKREEMRKSREAMAAKEEAKKAEAAAEAKAREAKAIADEKAAAEATAEAAAEAVTAEAAAEIESSEVTATDVVSQSEVAAADVETADIEASDAADEAANETADEKA